MFPYKLTYLINIYLSYKCKTNIEKYNKCTIDLKLFIDQLNSNNILIVSDYNADLRELTSFL